MFLNVKGSGWQNVWVVIRNEAQQRCCVIYFYQSQKNWSLLLTKVTSQQAENESRLEIFEDEKAVKNETKMTERSGEDRIHELMGSEATSSFK